MITDIIVFALFIVIIPFLSFAIFLLLIPGMLVLNKIFGGELLKEEN